MTGVTTDRRVFFAASAAAAAAITGAGVGVGLVLNESPATSAAHNAAKPSAQTGTIVPRQVEKAPPVDEVVPGDGTWVIGKEIKRGTYRTEGGSSCYWARSVRLAGHWVVVDSAFGPGAQEVALGKDDVAFDSQGCDKWVMVR